MQRWQHVARCEICEFYARSGFIEFAYVFECRLARRKVAQVCAIYRNCWRFVVALFVLNHFFLYSVRCAGRNAEFQAKKIEKNLKSLSRCEFFSVFSLAMEQLSTRMCWPTWLARWVWMSRFDYYFFVLSALKINISFTKYHSCLYIYKNNVISVAILRRRWIYVRRSVKQYG